MYTTESPPEAVDANVFTDLTPKLILETPVMFDLPDWRATSRAAREFIDRPEFWEEYYRAQFPRIAPPGLPMGYLSLNYETAKRSGLYENPSFLWNGWLLQLARTDLLRGVYGDEPPTTLREPMSSKEWRHACIATKIATGTDGTLTDDNKVYSFYAPDPSGNTPRWLRPRVCIGRMEQRNGGAIFTFIPFDSSWTRGDLNISSVLKGGADAVGRYVTSRLKKTAELAVGLATYARDAVDDIASGALISDLSLKERATYFSYAADKLGAAGLYVAKTAVGDALDTFAGPFRDRSEYLSAQGPGGADEQFESVRLAVMTLLRLGFTWEDPRGSRQRTGDKKPVTRYLSDQMPCGACATQASAGVCSACGDELCVDCFFGHLTVHK